MDTSQEQTSWQKIRVMFGRGLVVIIPIVISGWVLYGLFTWIDGIISPIFDRALNQHIPGLGFITMIILILIVGALSRNLIGRAMGKLFERIIFSIPVARTIYSAMKDLMGAFQIGGDGKSFRQVVIVEYPRMGLWTIGFVTNELTVHDPSGDNELASVYVPNPPNPTAGVLVLVPKASLKVLNITVEEGLKLVLSGGIVTSGSLSIKS